MTRIAIVSPTILPGDAIGNDILHTRRVLTAWGHEVELFSTCWGRPEPYSADDRPLADFLGRDSSALVLLHHAIGWPPAVRVITEARCRRVVRYHNVTPAHFYDNLSSKYADYCRTGRAQMRELARAGCDLYLSDSPFNQQELLEAGAPAERCRVVPPFHQVDRLVNVEPDPEVLRDYGDGRTNFLFVGRRVPNKGHRILLDAFAAYRRHHDLDSRLLLIGKGDAALAAYTAALRAQVRRLGLQGHVVFLEGVTEGELRACYESASAFLLASEHEGFCVPVVEALALGVPVVAYATTAVPDTLGQAGLAWPEPDPYLLAQSAARVANDGGLRRRLAEAGRRRYREHFATGRLERAFADALRPLLHAASSACV